MSHKKFSIYKSHGGMEHFSKKKLYSSLRRSGLANKESQIITDKVAQEVSVGSKTKDIFRKTLSLVNQTSPLAAVHYSLKRAIFDLGPSGHHFESFVARYFDELGYKTNVCKLLAGRLVKHEVDVIASRNGKRAFVECKFHNRVGIKNDIKITLYVKARWDDLKEGPEGKNLDAFYLASNTAFSLDAITYAKGTGLRLLGVNAPSENPFLEEIKSMCLYPITSLKNINKTLKKELLEKNIILAKDLPANINLLISMGMSESQIDHILKEIELLKGHYI
jgi:hypothetical protein